LNGGGADGDGVKVTIIDGVMALNIDDVDDVEY